MGKGGGKGEGRELLDKGDGRIRWFREFTNRLPVVVETSVDEDYLLKTILQFGQFDIQIEESGCTGELVSREVVLQALKTQSRIYSCNELIHIHPSPRRQKSDSTVLYFIVHTGALKV